MKDITLSDGEQLIEATPARKERAALNEQFRQGLAQDGNAPDDARRYDEVMAGLRGRVEVGRKLTRDEMN